MERHDAWFRNVDWSPEIEAAFWEKLGRARSRAPQSLQIQADYLAEKYPDVALRLIDEYFATGDQFFMPAVFCTQAVAFRSLGRVQSAVLCYKRALDWERAHPNYVTTARLDFPKLVVENDVFAEYDHALMVLGREIGAFADEFPKTRYLWNGCRALIAAHRGEAADAREFAGRALRAAAETHSRLRYHRSVGVVGSTDDAFGRRIRRIVES